MIFHVLFSSPVKMDCTGRKTEKAAAPRGCRVLKAWSMLNTKSQSVMIDSETPFQQPDEYVWLGFGVSQVGGGSTLIMS